MSAGATLQAAVERYLHERRQLGFELASTAHELMRFARFADARGHHGPLTQELQVDWARQHVQRTSLKTAAWRLRILRPFVSYYRQFEVDTEVPAPGLLGRRPPRPVPHIYTEKEIHDLMDEASRLPPSGGLRPLMAVRRLQLWHESGASIDQAMFWLCTYLGHAKISSTYWYLTGVPELMNIVGTKFEHFALQGVDHE